MPSLKNAKHERFAQELAKGKPASEAYVIAGYKESRPAASRLSTNVNIRRRVAELLERGAIRAEVTIASILDELDEARELARSIEQPAPMIAASLGKAKVAGLMVERAEITGKDGGPIRTEGNNARDLIAERIAGIAARTEENKPTSKPH